MIPVWVCIGVLLLAFCLGRNSSDQSEQGCEKEW